MPTFGIVDSHPGLSTRSPSSLGGEAFLWNPPLILLPRFLPRDLSASMLCLSSSLIALPTDARWCCWSGERAGEEAAASPPWRGGGQLPTTRGISDRAWAGSWPAKLPDESPDARCSRALAAYLDSTASVCGEGGRTSGLLLDRRTRSEVCNGTCLEVANELGLVAAGHQVVRHLCRPLLLRWGGCTKEGKHLWRVSRGQGVPARLPTDGILLARAEHALCILVHHVQRLEAQRALGRAVGPLDDALDVELSCGEREASPESPGQNTRQQGEAHHVAAFGEHARVLGDKRVEADGADVWLEVLCSRVGGGSVAIVVWRARAADTAPASVPATVSSPIPQNPAARYSSGGPRPYGQCLGGTHDPAELLRRR